MADLSVTPVGTQIKPMPTMSLSDMMNLARGAQAYQQAEQMNPLLLQQQQQTTSTGRIALTLEEQKERERMEMQKFLSKPENFQTNGRIDIDKLNAAIPSLAPLTGSDYVSKFTDLGKAQTEAIKAKQGLTQEQRNMVAQRFGILGRLGITDKNAYIAEMDLLKKENPDNPDLSRLIDAYKVTWKDIPSGPQLPSMAIAGANTLLSPQTQQQLFAPQAATINTGAATFPTITQPSVAGEAPRTTVGQTPLVTAQLPPGQREVPTGQYDVNNMPIVNVYDANGRFLGQRTSSETPSAAQLPGAQMPTPTGGMAPQTTMQPGMQPGGTPMVPAQPRVSAPPGQPLESVARMRPGETPQTLEAANKIRMSAADAAAQVPQRQFNNNQIIKIAELAVPGVGSEMMSRIAGGFAGVPWTGDMATYFNELGHYLKQETATLAQSSGLSQTDASRATAEATVGSTGWTREAIQRVARTNRALSSGTELFNRGVDRAFKDSNGNPFSARDFQNKWSTTLDINALRLYDAIKNNDKQAIQEVVKQVGGPQSSGYNNLKAKIAEMQRLIGVQ